MMPPDGKTADLHCGDTVNLVVWFPVQTLQPPVLFGAS
jgi:hypothetical protein